MFHLPDQRISDVHGAVHVQQEHLRVPHQGGQTCVFVHMCSPSREGKTALFYAGSFSFAVADICAGAHNSPNSRSRTGALRRGVSSGER